MIFALDRFYFEKDDNVDGSLLDEKLTSQTMKNEESILLVLNLSDKMNAMYKEREMNKSLSKFVYNDTCSESTAVRYWGFVM